MTGSGKYCYTHSTAWYVYDVIPAVTIYNQDDIPNTTLYRHVL